MIIGYGYKRRESDLVAMGADKVFIDTERARPERAEMMIRKYVRQGDTVLVLHMLDLGGTTLASEQFADKIKAAGAAVSLAPGQWDVRGGRPRKFDPQGDDDDYCRDIWLNEYYTVATKLEKISERLGYSVPRGGPDYRYKTKPKKQQEPSG